MSNQPPSKPIPPDLELVLKPLASYATLAPEMPAPNPVSTAPESKVAAFKIPLVCKRSGLLIGDFFPASGLAKNTPYVSAWKENSFLHPVFSMDLRTLIIRATACWQLEKSGTRNYPMRDKQLLFLAMLHASELIKQDIPGLPSPRTVETHFSRLVELLGWKYDVASTRISFPKLHVWKGAVREDENDIFRNVGSWLDVCEVCRDEYENVARERQKKAKQKAHELAMKNIRKAMYSDVSLKRLWNWFTIQTPSSLLDNNPDMEQLFFCEETQIHLWNLPDIEALESVFLKHCDLGTSVSHEFTKRINQLAEWLRIYNDTFEIVATDDRFAEYKGAAAPVQANYPTRGAFLIAQAKHQLANKESKPTTKPEKGADL